MTKPCVPPSGTPSAGWSPLISAAASLNNESRPGEGKSGCRTMVLHKSGELSIFVHGFAKSDRGNIRRDELAALKALAKEMLAYDATELAKAVASGILIEVVDDEEEQDDDE